VSGLLFFAVLGIGQGAMYAGIAVGLVVTYRGSGVVNLAYATMAAYPALVYHQLVKDGRLELPWVVVPAEIDLGSRLAPVAAFPVAVAAGLLLGVLVHYLVFRPLQDTPALTRLVASVGLTVVVQAVLVYRFGPALRRPNAILPDRSLHGFGRQLSLDRPLLVLVVVVLTFVVWLLLGRTMTGLATRAVAESPKGAALLGYDADRLALLNALLAAFVGATCGILLAPIAGVGPFSYSFFVVPALAAALAGKLKNLWPTVVVGIALGMFQAMLVRLKTFGFMPNALQGGFDEGVPFLLIAIVLGFIGKSLPDRGSILEVRHAIAGMPKRIARSWGVGVPLAAVVLLFADRTLRLPLIISLAMSVLMLSQVVLTGYLGQISLAQLTFAGLAAFFASKFSSGYGWPFPIGPLSAIVVTTILGVVISVPAARIRGVQLALVTLSFAIAAEQLVFRNPWFAGPDGVARIISPRLFGIDIGVLGPHEFPQRPFGLIVLVVASTAFLAVANMRRSATGRRMLAVRANERAAAAAGIDVPRTKLLGAGIAACLAGTAGVLMAYTSAIVVSGSYESRFALSLLALGFLGGIGRLSGALVAGVLVSGGIGFTVLEKLTGTSSPQMQLFVAGLGVLLVTRWMPDGVAGVAGPLRTLARRMQRPPRTQPLPAIELFDPVTGRPL
jgi:branched-chain amino acid transport system permease protein